MIQTVKEAHIYLDSRLAILNSNRQLSLSTQQKDMYLNNAVLQFIKSRSSFKLNSKGEGFEDTEKRYDDLKNLKVKEDTFTVYSDDTYGVLGVYVILPRDYYQLIPSGRSYINYSCHNVTKTTSSITQYYVTLPFPNDSTTGTSRYASTQIYIDGVSLALPAYSGNVRSVEGKFMMMQYVLALLINAGINAYWERYDNLYYRDSFIIVGGATTFTAGLTYTIASGGTYGTSTNGTTRNRTLTQVTNSSSTSIIKENDLKSSGVTIDSLSDHYAQKNIHEKPNAFMTGNRYYVLHNTKFVPTKISLEYIKKPLLISTELNQLCELDKMEEICDMAAQQITADVANNQLYGIMKDTNKISN